MVGCKQNFPDFTGVECQSYSRFQFAIQKLRGMFVCKFGMFVAKFQSVCFEVRSIYDN